MENVVNVLTDPMPGASPEAELSAMWSSALAARVKELATGRGQGRPVVVLERLAALYPATGPRAVMQGLWDSEQDALEGPVIVLIPGTLIKARVYRFLDLSGGVHVPGRHLLRARDREGASMRIREIFETRIEDKIEPVIKVAERQDEHKLAGEIGGYVVTPTIERYLDDYLERYTDTFRVDTTEIGVWISGYFGSGKSHLAKIAALLTENRSLEGVTAAKRFEAPACRLMPPTAQRSSAVSRSCRSARPGCWRSTSTLWPTARPPRCPGSCSRSTT